MAQTVPELPPQFNPMHDFSNLTTQAALSADMKITELGAGQAERTLGGTTE